MGEDIQALTLIGTPIAWLFSLPENDESRNGFSVTGGKFNYTAEVKFPKSGDSARIFMAFQGLDTFDYLKASVKIEGTLPKLRKAGQQFKKSVKVTMDDIEEDFTPIRPGMIVSNSKRVLEVENRQDLLVTEVMQTIEYAPLCKGDMMLASTLKSSRNYIVFDKKEGVARFALTSAIKSSLEETPCSQFNCNKFSFCLLDEITREPRCECLKGFIAFGRNGCADLDECSTNQHDCSESADCINTNGGYICQCKEGFIGNGTFCEQKISCEDLKCDVNAQCVKSPSNQAMCQCMEGFQGDGKQCRAIPTHLTFNGYSLEDEILLDPNEYPDIVTSVKDIGPLMEHTYELVNKGPSTVGNVALKLFWPLKDDQGRFLTYLHKEPMIYIQAAYGGQIFTDSCRVDSDNSINPRRLAKRQAAPAGEKYEDTDDYYADNFGLVVNNNNYPDYLIDELSPEDREIMSSYQFAEDDYDYGSSHFQSSENKTSFPMNSSLLEAVSLNALEGYARFTCTLNLAPGVSFLFDLIFKEYILTRVFQEVAKVKILAYVFAQELEHHYSSVALFQVPSRAELVENEAVISDSPSALEVVTNLRPETPPSLKSMLGKKSHLININEENDSLTCKML